MIIIPHNQEVLMTRQRHEADKAGLHYDYRMVIGDKAYSWATFKQLPEPGRAIILHEQPVHSREYALSHEVIIPPGQYGAGVTRLEWAKRGRIINPDGADDKFVLELPKGERFLFKKVPSYSDKAWLFKNLSTPTQAPKEELNKTAGEHKYETIPREFLESVNAEYPHMPNWADIDNPKKLNKRIGIRHKGKLVGFYAPREVELEGKKVWRTGTIYIKPEYRGKGLGSKAIQEFFFDKDKGVAYIEPSNTRSMGAFKKAGFRAIKNVEIYEGEARPNTLYTLMVKGAPENKYLEKASSLLAGAIAGHFLQNVGTKAALSSKHVSKYLANSFAEGTKGVVNTSFKAKSARFLSGAILPELAVAHKKAHEFGEVMKPILDKATKRQKVGLRMLSEGRLTDLQKHDLHNDPVIRKAHELASAHFGADLPKLNLAGKKVEEIFKDKSHPLVSNILAGISHGKNPVGPKFKPGHLGSHGAMTGAISSAIIEPAGGLLNSTKTLMSSKAFNDTRIGGKINHMLEKHFVVDPIKAGHKTSKLGNAVSNVKHRISEIAINPVSAHLKKTTAALSDAVKKS